MKKTALLFSFVSLYAVNSIAGTSNSPKWSASPFCQKVFIESKGQFDSEAKNILFMSPVDGLALFFKPNGITYNHNEFEQMTEKEKEKYESPRAHNKGEEEEENMVKSVPHYVSMEWMGANPNVQVTSENPVSFYYTYGDKINATAFQKITYKNLYPNIDVEYIFPSDKTGIKYSLILHPGANPSNIQMKWSEKKVSLDNSGNAVVKSSFGDFIDHAPQTFYANGGSVASSFLLNGKIISFSLPSYDNSKTVIIDPWTTSPTFTNNKPFDMGYDNNGNVYVYGSGAGYSAANPFQLAKINSAGALQWVYSSTLMSFLYNYGDMAVDKSTGNCYLGEGWHTNGGWPSVERITTNGAQSGVYTFSNPSNQKAVLEIWRMDFNECDNTLLLGTGGLPSPNSNTQCTILDASLNVITGSTTLFSTMDGVDVSLLQTDRYSCCQPFAYMMCAGMAPLTKPYGNKLMKVALPGLAPAWSVPTGHKFGEAMSNMYAGYGFAPSANNANGFNGIAISPTYVYTYDGDSLKRWDKSNGALVGTVDASPTAPTYNNSFFGSGAIQIYWGGLDVDECDNTYVGVGKAIKVYDLGWNLINTYNLPDTVYDLHLAPNNKLYACGKNYVTEITNTVATNSATYNVSISGTPSSGCSSCNGTANIAATATVTCGPAPVFNYSWAPGGQTTTSITGLCPGTYTVTVTTNCFPVATQTVLITGGSVVSATATSSPTTCGNNNGSASVTITTGTAPYTYIWSPSGGTSSTASNLSAGNYTVTVTDAGGCSTIQIVSVAPSTNITATAGPNSSICDGQSVTISATGGGNYSWTNGNTNSSINISPTYTTTYSVIVSVNGCSDTATATVTVNPSPTVAVPGSTICIGDAATLTATGGTNYSWSNGSTANPISVNPPSTTTYTVVGTNANGCSNSTQVTVAVAPPPVATATSATICSGQNALLSATGGGNYQWSNGSQNSSINVSPAATTNYSVVISVGSCTDTAFSSVFVNPSPSVALGNNQTICDGQNLTLNAGNSGASYFWSTGATSQSINVSGAGTYWVIVALNNCLAKDTVATFTAPKVHLFDSSLCTTSPIILDPGAGASGYLWSNGSTSQTISVDNAGNYWVVAIFGNCMSSDSSTITGDGTGGALFVPNAFTPNGDHLNEVFLAKGNGINSFDMKIFDRWGNLIFRTDDMNEGWDGKIQGGNYTLKGDGNEVSQEDVYIWKIDYTTQCFPLKVKKEIGHVIIVK